MCFSPSSAPWGAEAEPHRWGPSPESGLRVPCAPLGSQETDLRPLMHWSETGATGTLQAAMCVHGKLALAKEELESQETSISLVSPVEHCLGDSGLGPP
jgi:hypothetical protein